MPECQSCGSHVSEQFKRVLGDNQGTVHACLECASKAEINYAVHGKERPHMWQGETV